MIECKLRDIAYLLRNIAEKLDIQLLSALKKEPYYIFQYHQKHLQTAVAAWSTCLENKIDFDVKAESSSIEINYIVNADMIYQVYLQYEFAKVPYSYALSPCAYTSDVFVAFLDGSRELTYRAFSSWVYDHAEYLEPKILLYKSAKDYQFGQTAESLSWYWLARFRLSGDLRKANIRCFLPLEEYSFKTMQAYLGCNFNQWRKALTKSIKCQNQGLLLFGLYPASNAPSWINHCFPGVECGQVLEKKEWPQIDQQIIHELSLVLEAKPQNNEQSCVLRNTSLTL